jgi:glycosyltransferase involved in cell wall biosynthesis
MLINENKILLLTDGMMPGGVERHVVHLANGLYKKGVLVSVAATDGPFRNLLDPLIPFLQLPLLYDGTSRKRPLGFLSAVLILQKYIQDNKISIIHSHKRYTDFIARLVVSFSREIVHVSTCHSLFTDMTWLPSFGYYTIACSKNVEKMLIHVFGKSAQSVRTIYNCAPALSKYSAEQKIRIKEQFGIPAQVRIICSVGSLIKIKNPEALLRAFVNLITDQRMTDIHLVIVGEGDQVDFVNKYVDRHALHKRVTLLPANTPVEEVFNIAEFCVLSSVREGFPLVLLEAASIGKPYIATEIGGVAEFIEHNKNGILVPQNDTSALTEAISYLLNNPSSVQLFGENARMKYQQYFTLERMIKETMEVYEHMLKIKDTKA